LTRNPLDKDGTTKSIAQEGRAHLEITIVLSVIGDVLAQDDETRRRVASLVMRLVESMRIAGGTIVPGIERRQHPSPQLLVEDSDPERRVTSFNRLKRSWLPGSALVLREDLLHETYTELQVAEPDTTLVDALLYHSRVNYRAHKSSKQVEGKQLEQVEWRPEKKKGWVVPIPVGYCALSEVYENEQVKGSRDDATSFRFVESIYSLGEWVGAHRLQDVREILWYPSECNGIYQCENGYARRLSKFHD
jgi:CRISPR-associated protein Csy2